MRISPHISTNLVYVLAALLDDQNTGMMLQWASVLTRIAQEVKKEATAESRRVIGCAPVARCRVKVQTPPVDAVMADVESNPDPERSES